MFEFLVIGKWHLRVFKWIFYLTAFIYLCYSYLEKSSDDTNILVRTLNLSATKKTIKNELEEIRRESKFVNKSVEKGRQLVEMGDHLAETRNQLAKMESQVAFQRSQVASTLQDTSKSKWIPVKGSNNKLFIYSAYYDTRLGYPSIRLIAIIRKWRFKFKCKIWTEKGGTKVLTGTAFPIREHGSMKYNPCFIVCKDFNLKKGDSITEVSISLRNFFVTKINVTHLDKRKWEGTFSVCVQPLFDYNKALWIVEFIEFHRILGVEKFFFYNRSMGVDVENTLQYYVKENIVELYDWKVPVDLKDIRHGAIYGALNDCNLKNVGRYEWTIFVDVDEFILPKKAKNYADLINSLEKKNSYVFQNAFFYLYWNNDTNFSRQYYGSPDSLGSKLFGSELDGPFLRTAYKTKRISSINHGIRSKYMFKPMFVIDSGNHYVWEFIGQNSSLNVSAEDAILHHYRVCEYEGYECIIKEHEIDVTAYKWLPPLLESVAKVCLKIFPSLGKCPPVSLL
ncbi:UNVERIFIED_CONTAM: hypothetical protein RMT77_000030 [Armadillidium vulgare]